MEKERITFLQGLEVASWLARLSCDEYQARRAALRKVTDPRAVLDGAWWLHPFLTPLRKGLRLKTQGPECPDVINVNDLDFITGDVLRLDKAGAWETSTSRFSEHHAEHLLGRWEELPRFDNGTEVVFPGTVYISTEGPEVEFHPCLCFNMGAPTMGMIARYMTLQSNCRFPYHLHSKR